MKYLASVLVIAAVACFGLTTLPAQSRMGEIVRSSKNFNEIISAGENYFQKKHPNLPLKNLTSGEYRDGEYVKFMRWQHFWKNSLNEDGTLGDPSAYFRNRSKQDANALEKDLSPYKDVPWTNISYSDYIVSQIGLGRTTSMGFHPTNPDIFYVGAAIGGIWGTTDGGQSYTPLGDDLPFMAVSSIIVKKDQPNVLYLATGDQLWFGSPSVGVFKSIDSGQTWQPTALSFEMADWEQIHWMEADPLNPAKVFVAASNGLYVTYDGFQNITKINELYTYDVRINPGNPSIVYQGTANGEVYRSTDAGVSFTLAQDLGNGSVYLATTPLNPAKVYARVGSTLYKSVDNGASFPTSESLPTGGAVFTFSPASETSLLFGYYGIDFVTQRSDNDGAGLYHTSHWLGQNSLPSIHVDQRNMFVNPLESDYVYYCNDGGVYRYVISTNSFENLSDGLMITQFYDIAVAQTDANVLGGGSQDNGNVFRESDGSWDDFAPTGDGMNQEIDPTDANVRYWAYQNGSMHRWENGVNTHISPPGESGQGAWETPYRLDPSDPNRLVAGYLEVYSSPDRGNTWTSISGILGELHEIAIAKSNSERIYASSFNNLFVKNIGANTWVTRSLPAAISDIEVDPDDMNTLYITIPGFIAGSKVYKSSDAGASWTNISGSLPNVSTGAIELYEDIPGGMFVGTDAGVFYRDNALGDWQEYGQTPHSRVEDIEIQYAARLIRIGTYGRGVMEAPLVIETCDYGDPDADNDGVCDANDACPDFDNALVGTPCDDGDPFTVGETWSVNCNCEGGVSIINYCNAAGLEGTGGDWIEGVSLHTLAHRSGYSQYSDFREHATTLEPGGSYTLRVDLFESFELDAVYAWIDYDRDEIFENSELIVMGDFDAEHISTGQVNVPTDVLPGAATMRVRTIYLDPNIADPCNDYYGEVEDYTVNITYCAARGNYGTGDDWIKKVKLNTLEHTSTQTYYSDFTEYSTDLVRGGSYPLEVSLNYAFDINSVYAWVDFNQDGLFGASERISMSSPPGGNNGLSSGTIVVPENAVPGKTVMRVRSQYDDPDDPQACGSIYAGEVEDYTVNITYCAAGGLPGTGDDYISRVRLNTIDNASGQTAYSDFMSISTDLIRGADYPIEVNLNYAFDIDRVHVWIDYDKDGVFESTERVLLSTPTPNMANASTTGIIQVPADAIMGETVMRIRCIYDASANDPCGSDLFGEVEDYTVNLTHCGAAGSTGADFIDQVRLKTIDHTSGDDGYSNFKDQATTLYRDVPYTLEVAVTNAFSDDKMYAWIDYDKNGAFTSEERIGMSDPGFVGANLSTGNILLASNTPLGETTLRIRFSYGGPPNPCGNYSGEVEDYTIIVGDTCPDTDNDTVCDDLDLCVGYSDLPLVLTEDPVANEDFSTVFTIESNVTIDPGLEINYRAGESITLEAGFHARAGSNFTARISECPEAELLVTEVPQTEETDEEVKIFQQEAGNLPADKRPDLKVFPNPFRHSTTIDYYLPEGTPLQLFITDIRGRRIATLLNTAWKEAGNHRFEWQNTQHTSGILLLYFRTGDEVMVRRLLIAR